MKRGLTLESVGQDRDRIKIEASAFVYTFIQVVG